MSDIPDQNQPRAASNRQGRTPYQTESDRVLNGETPDSLHGAETDNRRDGGEGRCAKMGVGSLPRHLLKQTIELLKHA